MPAEMKAILGDINENFASIKHIKELLARHFVSSATLNRWFREYLSVSPREYVESKKLSNAVKLLSAGASVTDACMRSGFSDCSHFIILFKKKFGKTPFRYKATHVYEL
jgi:AraC-like DNA-binding protein